MFLEIECNLNWTPFPRGFEELDLNGSILIMSSLGAGVRLAQGF
jgi:hypothetical protein